MWPKKKGLFISLKRGPQKNGWDRAAIRRPFFFENQSTINIHTSKQTNKTHTTTSINIVFKLVPRYHSTTLHYIFSHVVYYPFPYPLPLYLHVLKFSLSVCLSLSVTIFFFYKALCVVLVLVLVLVSLLCEKK